MTTHEYTHWEFDEWVWGWFDHDGDLYSLTDEAVPENVSPEQSVDYATRLFETARETLAIYSDNQVALGLDALIGADSPLFALRDPHIPIEVRCRCLQAISKLYEQVFAPRCDELLGNLSEKTSKINGVCYMWWDNFPVYGEGLTTAERDTTLGVMEHALQLPHAACQESALHGLGHWHLYHPQLIERMVDTFLTSNDARRPELLPYAKAARQGMVL